MFGPQPVEKLTKFIRDKADGLQWKSTGEIVVDDQRVHGSNLSSLLCDVVHKAPSSKPVGYREFATVLRRSGLPPEVVFTLYR